MGGIASLNATRMKLFFRSGQFIGCLKFSGSFFDRGFFYFFIASHLTPNHEPRIRSDKRQRVETKAQSGDFERLAQILKEKKASLS